MTTLDKTTIGNRIRYERQKAGLTLEELGSRIGVSKQCLSGWEHGRNMPDVISLNNMSQVFHITIEEFLHEPNASVTSLTPASTNANHHQFSEKEIQLINKLRTFSAERRKAVEVLFGIRDKK